MRKQINSLLWRPSFGRRLSYSLNLPLRIEFVITSACNGRCIMCDYKPRGRMMPFELFRKVAQRSLPRARETFLIGGEPLLHPDFYRISKLAFNRRTKVFATTNLSRLDISHADALKNFFTGLTVSVDSMDAAVYQSIRPGLSFKTLKNNLLALSKIGAGGLSVNIAAVAFRKNISSLPDLVDLVSDLGFDRLIINIATIRQTPTTSSPTHGKLPVKPSKNTHAAKKSVIAADIAGASSKLPSRVILNRTAPISPGFSPRANSRAALRQIAPPQIQIMTTTNEKYIME